MEVLYTTLQILFMSQPQSVKGHLLSTVLEIFRSIIYALEKLRFIWRRRLGQGTLCMQLYIVII